MCAVYTEGRGSSWPAEVGAVDLQQLAAVDGDDADRLAAARFLAVWLGRSMAAAAFVRVTQLDATFDGILHSDPRVQRAAIGRESGRVTAAGDQVAGVFGDRRSGFHGLCHTFRSLHAPPQCATSPIFTTAVDHV